MDQKEKGMSGAPLLFEGQALLSGGPLGDKGIDKQDDALLASHLREDSGDTDTQLVQLSDVKEEVYYSKTSRMILDASAVVLLSMVVGFFVFFNEA